jgi:gentisate 1,2-dioxygenase
MSTTPGRIEELPQDYRDRLIAQNTLPLWPSLRALLPHGLPNRKTRPTRWRYADVRPNLLRAGELVPIEKAERRVLVLCNPGLGLEALQATPTIYVGLQLILPGETAPNHQHTPSAVRIAIEGRGAFTLVNGEKLTMEKGDVILTPSGSWHEHGHEGDGPFIWMDALDLPLIYGIEASFSREGPAQAVDKPAGFGGASFARAGVLPYASLDRQREPHPLLRFAWNEVKASLAALASVTPIGQPVHLAYVNPETGRECLPTLGLSALQLRPAEEIRFPRRSASAVLHVIEGGGTVGIDDSEHPFEEADVIAVPTHSAVTVRNASTDRAAYLLVVDDAPLQRKLAIYQATE